MIKIICRVLFVQHWFVNCMIKAACLQLNPAPPWPCGWDGSRVSTALGRYYRRPDGRTVAQIIAGPATARWRW
jgi:hypothetical protein